MGSTRRWRRGQMQRARDRDQRLAAGAQINPQFKPQFKPLWMRVCMGCSAALRIACGQRDFYGAAGALSKAVDGTSGAAASSSSTTGMASKACRLASSAAVVIQQTAAFLSRLQAISTVY